MEITEVEAIPMESTVGTVSMRLGTEEQSVSVLPVLVKVRTDEGVTGVGETLTYDPEGLEARYVARGVRMLADDLVGTDPLDVTQRWHELYQKAKRSGTWKPLSGIDEALWDVVGKHAGRPLYELLGGRTDPVGAYATYPYRKPTEALLEDVPPLAEAGFRFIKITVGRDAEADAERIRTVSDHLPEGFGLAIDANTSYGLADALAVGRTAGECGLAWFEEPIPHTDLDGQADLNRRLDVPIAGYQSYTPHYPAVEHLTRNALEVYQPALYLSGGVTGAWRVATLVEAFDKRFVPHAFGPLVNYAASLHVCAASPACDLIEFAIYDDEADDPGAYVAGPYVANQDEFFVDTDGHIAPPDRPGLGVELDEDAVEDLRLD